MNCPWCEGPSAVDNPRLNKKVVDEHLLIVTDKVGHYHIHAPFGSPGVIERMIDFLIDEAKTNGIEYVPRGQNRGQIRQPVMSPGEHSRKS